MTHKLPSLTSYSSLIHKINEISRHHYPLPVEMDEMIQLSHFKISSNYWEKFLPFQVNVKGRIVTGPYKNHQILHLFTTQLINWNDYINHFTLLLNKSYYPCIDENNFLCLLHTFNFIDELNIKRIVIKKGDGSSETIDIVYGSKSNFIWNNNLKFHPKIEKENHFYLESFQVNTNYKKLKVEITRLVQNRDRFHNIHFHLDNNGGGDIVPAHIIIRCLVGKKEKWMKNIKKLLTDKTVSEWDCWKEEDVNSPNYNVVEKLNLNYLPEYTSKYSGKIYVHMNKQNGSAAWFFITYLIYAFGGKINRFETKCCQQKIKYGNLEKDSQLILKGHSGTTSGDGNAIQIKYKNIQIECPTQQFISCSIKDSDWNRFWIE